MSPFNLIWIIFQLIKVKLMCCVDVIISCHSAEEWVVKVAQLKRNCFAAVFEKYFDIQAQKKDEKETAIIHYRDKETMYV